MLIKLTVPQTQFTMCGFKYPLFVAGFGSGKSTCLVTNALNDLQYPGADIGLYAPTYDLLNLILVPYLEEWLTESGIPYKLNKSNHIMKVEGHGDIIMRSLDNPRRIVGYQVFRSHLDEIDTIGEKQARESWNKVIARNRQKIYVRDNKGQKVLSGMFKLDGSPKYRTYMNRVSAYTTPEGFGFCYKRWQENPAPGYGMIRASTYSNIDNLPDDYIDSLKSSYPPALIDAYIEGIFVNLTSGACYPQFDRKLNHCDVVPEEYEPIHVGMDFNVMKGAASIHVIRNDTPYLVDEIFNAYDTDEQIRTLKERYPNRLISIYPDSAGKNRTSSNTTQTDIAKLEGAGFEVIYDFSNPAIKDRVHSVQAMICNGNQERRYFVNTKKCPEATKCLEQQVWGDNGLPDKKAGLDHMTDSIGYFIWQKYPIVFHGSHSVTVYGRY